MAIVKAKGLITFAPHKNAPAFVLGAIVISRNKLNDFFEGEGKEWVTDYRNDEQLKIQVTSMKEGRGILLAVDTYKAAAKQDTSETVKRNQERIMAEQQAGVASPQQTSDDLPF